MTDAPKIFGREMPGADDSFSLEFGHVHCALSLIGSSWLPIVNGRHFGRFTAHPEATAAIERELCAIADAINEARSEPEEPWIPCSERLPESAIACWLAQDEGVHPGYFEPPLSHLNGYFWHNELRGPVKADRVTHWKPRHPEKRPEPPKEVERG